MLEIRNLDRWDRAARIAIGSGLLAVVYKANRFDPWTLGGAISGAALLVTGLAGLCMLYSLLGSEPPDPAALAAEPAPPARSASGGRP